MSDIIEDFNPETGNSKTKKKINPLFIHIGFLLLLLLVIVVFLLADFSFFSEDDSRPILKIVGSQENFSLEYQGDLLIDTNEYSLRTQTGLFDGNSQQFSVKNFSGTISLEDKSIFFEGVGQNISFGKNKIQLDGGIFVLNSSQKTTLSFLLDSLSMNFTSGTFKFDESLTYDFEEAQIDMVQANMSMVYDGIFSFKGYVDSFTFNNRENISIIYQ